MITLDEIRMGAGILRRLPGLLRHPVTPEEARATIARRLAGRDADFLALLRRAVYEHPSSPYLALLRQAGCEYGDLAALVGREGIEGALGALLRHGVYLTVDEFKGRRPLRRGSAGIPVTPAGLSNPTAATHLRGHTSGTRGGGVPVPIDLAYVREWAITVCADIAARGGLEWQFTPWMVPGGAMMGMSLAYVLSGLATERWFSLVNLRQAAVHAKYRWSDRLLRGAGWLGGIPLPRLEFVSARDPGPILAWLGARPRTGRTPYLLTYVSPALALGRAAREAGIDLAGVRLFVIGEPLTETRLEILRRTGADVMTNYGSMEAGFIAQGCLAPAAPDDVHVLRDLLAVIQPPDEFDPARLPPGALLVTTIRPTAPLVLLNVSMGDRGILRERRCGCPLESLGWTPHLHGIRSFEKLTAGGMTFLDTDIVRVLEEVLPVRFGGGPTDYQVVEEEGRAGEPRLRLLVRPEVGTLDSREVAEAFVQALSEGSPAARVMTLAWGGARFVEVERRTPIATATGKVLHLHVRPGPGPHRPA